MERYFEVMRRSIELSETIEEGLLYIEKRIKEGCLEEVQTLFNDIIEGFTAINDSIEVFKGKLIRNNLDLLTEKVWENLELLSKTYDLNNIIKVNQIIIRLISDYNFWKNELHRVIGTYINN